eukprot:scaffold166592_cov55-Attheya_sp.AAC.9
MDHGCNNTSNVGHLAAFTTKGSNTELTKHELISARSPVLDRHLSSYAMGYLLVLRDVSEGEELRTDYLHRRSENSKWTELSSKIEEYCK